jgi:hypothetical protein
VGIDIEKLSEFFGQDLASFFSNKSRLSLFVGGDADFESTFSGKIYKFGFSTNKNLEKISVLFDDSGFLSY